MNAITSSSVALILTTFLLTQSCHAEMNSTAGCQLTDPVNIRDDLTLQHIASRETGTITMKVTYTGGNSYIGIGINLNGQQRMIPSAAVIGRTLLNEQEIANNGGSASSTMKYTLDNYNGVTELGAELQTLQNVSFEQPDASTSIMTFTQFLEEDGRDAISDETAWIYAVGGADNRWGFHDHYGFFLLGLSYCEDDSDDESPGLVTIDSVHPNKAAWIIHGFLMAVSFGLLMPLAIGASFARIAIEKYGISSAPGTWYKCHFYLNTTAVVFVVVAFITAVVLTESEEAPHFLARHHVLGTVISVFVVVQALNGFFRPPATQTVEQHEASDDDEEGNVRATSTNDNDHTNGGSDASEKTTIRAAWEIGHRVLGTAIVIMAWRNCISGLQLLTDNWDNVPDLKIPFMVIAFGLSAILLVVGIVARK